MESELAAILVATEETKVDNALEMGARLLAIDIKKLPKPRSQISKSGYTHLLDSVDVWRDELKAGSKVRLGWRKYYGPILEHGSYKMGSQPHLKPTWERNKAKYQKEMIENLKLGGN
nr:HK97-gp10 family putative phage morphogenesis protein [Alkalibacter mobilis]